MYLVVACKQMTKCVHLSRVVYFPFIGTEARVMCTVIRVMGHGCFPQSNSEVTPLLNVSRPLGLTSVDKRAALEKT